MDVNYILNLAPRLFGSALKIAEYARSMPLFFVKKCTHLPEIVASEKDTTLTRSASYELDKAELFLPENFIPLVSSYGGVGTPGYFEVTDQSFNYSTDYIRSWGKEPSSSFNSSVTLNINIIASSWLLTDAVNAKLTSIAKELGKKENIILVFWYYRGIYLDCGVLKNFEITTSRDDSLIRYHIEIGAEKSLSQSLTEKTGSAGAGKGESVIIHDSNDIH